jgi:hypothetical protein
VSETVHDWSGVLKALAAAAAGRALLLLAAKRDAVPSWAKLCAIALYELPLIGALAFVGWHAAGWLWQSADDDARVVITVMLAWSGQRGADLIMSRLWPTGGQSAGQSSGQSSGQAR